MDAEINNQLSFLDIKVFRSLEGFSTSVFRKSTFTGLGLNFFSFCPINFKLNSCKTLMHRAFTICSSWLGLHEEIMFLEKYFKNNCYPSCYFSKVVRNFLDSTFRPLPQQITVPKLKVYISLPYMGNLTSSVKHELTKSLETLYPYVKFNFIFKNTFTINSLFRFKDNLPELMRSLIVY